MSEKSPPPPSSSSPPLMQHQDLQRAKALLKKSRWTVDGPNGMHEILSKIIEFVKSNMRTIVGATNTSKKREWEKARAVGLVLKEHFTLLQEDKMVVEVLDRRFESKLDDLVGQATSLKFSNDSAVAQIISEKFQEGLKDSICKMMQEIDVSWKAAEEVMDRCEWMMKEAKERIGEMGGKMDKLVIDIVGVEGERKKMYENWDMVNGNLKSAVNSQGEIQLNFAAALQVGAAKKAEKVASEAAGSVLQAPHAQVIR
ncbi:hypothetical protein J3R30DRAFT_3399799 [Lentinula aciculospora]|uniref:Uncharacterized protein n=1 Tax=Lentinula aciculospora TaxID=153920 RepID=A0A9W9DXE6_9AGAR|nr:hypothetical protein J3R30DRAFT_3399799 [Lentinula aciculospora]